MKHITLDAEVITRAVDTIITREELGKLLVSGKQLRIKYGVDVTASTLHIGHAVNLWKMRELQDAGHKVVFLIGDFTTRIGDPTGRTESRKKIEIKNSNAWAKQFISQVGQILRTEKKVFEVRKNSEWYAKMNATRLLELLSLFTHARLIERDMFQKRIEMQKEIGVQELIYPVLQGYDSVMVRSDLTIIGSDQLFNETIGRTLQEKFGQRPQVLMTTSITPGLDGGPKMSKSVGNYIGLSDSPEDKFGKAMRILDALIIPYLEVYTSVSRAAIAEEKEKLARGENPMESKLFFAESLTARYHGTKIAQRAREKFLQMFSRGETPSDMPEIHMKYGVCNSVEFLMQAGLAPSKSEARRLIAQGAVEIDGKILLPKNRELYIKKGMIVKVGKRKFVRVV